MGPNPTFVGTVVHGQVLRRAGRLHSVIAKARGVLLECGAQAEAAAAQITWLPAWLQWVGQALPLYWLGLGVRSALLPRSLAVVEIGHS